MGADIQRREFIMLVGGAGMPQSQVLGDILLHLFNNHEPPPLDLLVFQRGGTAPDLEKTYFEVVRSTDNQ